MTLAAAMLLIGASQVTVAAETNEWLPNLKDGNYERWIDRLDLPEYAVDFYNLLEEGSDNDGVDDFMIDPSSSDFVKEYVESIAGQTEETTAKGIIVATVEGTGTSWEDAVAKYENDYMEKINCIDAVYQAFERDHSEVFWMSGATYIIAPEYETSWEYDQSTSSYIYKYSGDLYFVLESEGYDWHIWHQKYKNPELIRSTWEEIEEDVEKIVAGAEGKDDVEKIRYFNEWLTTHNEYNTLLGSGTYTNEELFLNNPDCCECIAALDGRTGSDGPICESYSRAFKMLCDAVEIPCVVVDGYAKYTLDDAGGYHMWNYVEADGAWYGVDVTWNDPLYGASGAVSGNEVEDYVLVGANTELYVGDVLLKFGDSHPATNQVITTGVSFINGPVLSPYLMFRVRKISLWM